MEGIQNIDRRQYRPCGLNQLRPYGRVCPTVSQCCESFDVFVTRRAQVDERRCIRDQGRKNRKSRAAGQSSFSIGDESEGAVPGAYGANKCVADTQLSSCSTRCICKEKPLRRVENICLDAREVNVGNFGGCSASSPRGGVQGSQLGKTSRTPSLRNQSQRRLLELSRKQPRRGRIHALGLATFSLCTHRVEVDEPTLEQGLRDGFEGGVGLAQDVDAAI